MLSLQNKQLNSIFERIIRDSNGVLVRVRFTVVEIDGKFQGQIISVTPLVATSTAEDVVCLPCLKENKVATEKLCEFFDSIVSPYFYLEFFMSQPTRAPAFAI
jgi:hypothetical protein